MEDLEILIAKYLQEDYSFFKYRDSDGRDLKVAFVFENHRDYLAKYLSFYSQLPNMTEVVVFACDGIFKLTQNGLEYFIKHPHQEVFTDKQGNERGIKPDVLKEMKTRILKRIGDLVKAKTFDELMSIIESEKVRGFGELAIYDTTMRISSFLKLEPDKVYLHAGTREGMKKLEERGLVPAGSAKRKAVPVDHLPEPLKRLRPAETEHLLCWGKGYL
jgi:hypothetical protein